MTLEESIKVSFNQRKIGDHQYCIFSAALESVVAANKCVILHHMTWLFCNHRMIWAGRDLKAHPVLIPLPWDGCQSLDQAVQDPLQPGLGHLQGEGNYSFSGHVSLNLNFKSRKATCF